MVRHSVSMNGDRFRLTYTDGSLKTVIKGHLISGVPFNTVKMGMIYQWRVYDGVVGNKCS